MKINLLGKTLLAAVLVTGLFTGCSELDCGRASIGDTESIKNRSAVAKLAYMGGSAVYNGSDESISQLAENVVLAVRLGKVEKTALGDGSYACKNSETDFNLGFFEINVVDKDGITFTYNKFRNDSDVYDNMGSYTIKLGEGCDIDGDSKVDVRYEVAKNGVKNNRWLTFVNDMEDRDTSVLFAVIPEQYENKAYPAGLVGVNSDGRSIVTKYNVSNNGRACVANISYGDYVIDSETNTCSMYVGSGIKARGARALNDSELETVQMCNADDYTDFLFKPQEFAENYSIQELLASLPASIVTKSYSGMTIADATDYLNDLIMRDDFIGKLVDGKSGDVADEIRNQLAMSPISSDAERVLFNRHSIALLYPELCPDFSMASTSISVVFPWLSVDFGKVATADEIEEEARQIMARGAVASSSEVKEYSEYLAKRKAIEKKFDELTSYDVAPLLGGIIGNARLAALMNQTKVQLKIGVGGYLSTANGDLHVGVKLCILTAVDVQDRLTFNIAGTSLFEKEEPKIKSVEDYKKMYPNSSFTDEKEIKKIFMFDEKETKKEWGIDKWYFNWSNEGETVNTLGYIYPSASAKSFHKSFAPVKVLPVVFTFDGQFDLLFKMNAVAEFNNLYVGGVGMYGVELNFGVDWGFREWFKIFGVKIAPKVWTFHFDPFGKASVINESASYCGMKTNDKNMVKVGAGVMAQIIPVVQIRGGVGIGTDIVILEADATAGVKFTVAAPIGGYIGMNYNVGTGDVLFVTEAAMNVQATVGVDLQIYLDPPLVSAKRWHYDIWRDQAFKWQIFSLRTENFKMVKSEGFKVL